MKQGKGSTITRFASKPGSIFLFAVITGLTWGLLRIELVLLVPYYYLGVYVFDAVAYVLIGYLIGRYFSPSQRINLQLLLAIVLVYVFDRFVSPQILLGLSFAGRITSVWRLATEIFIVVLAIIAAWWGLKKAIPKHAQDQRRFS